MIFYILTFLSGAFVSFFITYIIFSKKLNSAREELITLKSKTNSAESIMDMIKNDFVRLANETIKNEQEDLRKQNREALEEKIFPLTKELGEFKQKVESFNEKGVENTTKIIEQILNLEKNNKVIEQEAKNLVQALTKNQNIKGSYGEDILDTLLQSCGMIEGVHYTKQYVTTSTNIKDEELHKIRPDIVINLPDDRHLIIDSKVTLTSYLRYIEDESNLGEFKAEVKKRIMDLANKNYQNAGDLSQPDFILMYMPVEASVNVIYAEINFTKIPIAIKIAIAPILLNIFPINIDSNESSCLFCGFSGNLLVFKSGLYSLFSSACILFISVLPNNSCLISSNSVLYN